MRACIALTTTVAFIASVCPVSASPLPAQGTFIYSSLCIKPFGGGDLSGYRIKLVRSPNGDSLYIEYNSEGPLSGPALATNLVVAASTGRISFTIPANAPPNYGGNETQNYTGLISNEVVVLDQDPPHPLRREAMEENVLKVKECR